MVRNPLKFRHNAINDYDTPSFFSAAVAARSAVCDLTWVCERMPFISLSFRPSVLLSAGPNIIQTNNKYFL